MRSARFSTAIAKASSATKGREHHATSTVAPQRGTSKDDEVLHSLTWSLQDFDEGRIVGPEGTVNYSSRQSSIWSHSRLAQSLLGRIPACSPPAPAPLLHVPSYIYAFSPVFLMDS